MGVTFLVARVGKAPVGSTTTAGDGVESMALSIPPKVVVELEKPSRSLWPNTGEKTTMLESVHVEEAIQRRQFSSVRISVGQV